MKITTIKHNVRKPPKMAPIAAPVPTKMPAITAKPTKGFAALMKKPC